MMGIGWEGSSNTNSPEWDASLLAHLLAHLPAKNQTQLGFLSYGGFSLSDLSCKLGC